MLLDDFLCKDAFTMVNKKLAKTIWIGQAMLLSEMLYQRKKADNEVFEFSWTEMEDELWVSPKTQQRYINELKKLWLISVEKWGLHNKNFFKINDEAIISVFPNGESTPVKMTTVQKSKWPDSSYIYKKEDIKKGEECSTSSLDSALEEFLEYRKKIKKPIATEDSKKRFISHLNSLAQTNEEKIEILHQSIDCWWIGIFPLKNKTSTEPQTNMEWAQFYDKCYSEWTHKEKILEKYGREKYEKIKSLWVWRCVTGTVDDSFKL